MSQSIGIAFVEAFGPSVFQLAQQKNSRFRNRVTVEEGIVGRSKDYDRIGQSEMKTKTGRHSDSPLMDTPHSRRRVTFIDKEWGELIDQLDKVKTLIEPTNVYNMAARAAAGRQIDDIVIAALDGNATAVDENGAGSSVVFGTGQVVAVDFVKTGAAVNSNLTVKKLQEAKRLFLANEVPEDEPLTCAVRASQIMALLDDDEVTSSDFSSLQALMRGDITNSFFMGFTFIHSERLLVESTDHFHIACFSRRGLQLSFNQDIVSQIAQRPDKSYAWYPYISMALGAVRMDEKDVVRILCDETPA